MSGSGLFCWKTPFLVEARKYQPRQRIIFSDKRGDSSGVAISPWEATSELRHRNYFLHSKVINDGGKISSEDFRVFQQNRPITELQSETLPEKSENRCGDQGGARRLTALS